MLHDEYYDLGGYGRPVTTTSADAQAWFDRGLAWCYGFNHEEAVRCFQRAVEADPACAMAHWGIAYAIGPNYNKDWDAFEPAGADRRGRPPRTRAVDRAPPSWPAPARRSSGR